MENYTTYLDNVVELILYKIFSKLSPNILMSNTMLPLLQDDIISHIGMRFPKNILNKPISNFEPGPFVGPTLPQRIRIRTNEFTLHEDASMQI